MTTLRLFLVSLFMIISAGLVHAELTLDLNSATIEQLETIPHIGEQRAKAIIEYREQQGAFESLADLDNVKGFSSALISKLESYLVVE